MPTTKSSTPASISTLTEAQRKKLAADVLKARTAKQPWDGEDGIVNDARFPLINSAQVGRKLLREIGKAEVIAKSYDRQAKGLAGPRVAPSNKQVSAAAKKAPRNGAAKKTGTPKSTK